MTQILPFLPEIHHAAILAVFVFFRDTQGVDLRLRINSAGSVRCEPTWQWDPRPDYFSDFDLWYVWAGVGTLSIDAQSIPAQRGRLFTLRPRHEYHGRHDRQRRLGVCFIHFDFLDSAGRAVAPDDAQVPPHHCDVRDPDLYERLLRRIVTLHKSDRGTDRIAANRLLESVLLGLDHDRLPDTGPDDARLREARIAEVMNYIRENPGQIFPISELAEQAAYAVDHFTRVFTSVAGVSPKEFCIRARLERAQELLRASDLPLKEIASALGYADVYFFSRQFKARMGQSPSDWRASPQKP